MTWPNESVYLSACQMLSSILGIYEDWSELGLAFPYWRKDNDVIADLIELVDEPRFADYDKMGEVADAYAMKLAALAGESREKDDRQFSTSEYILYCLWMIRVLDRFAGIVLSTQLSETPFPEFYSSVEQDFIELKQSIIQSANAGRERLGLEVWGQFERFAEELAEQWLAQVYEDAG